MKTKYTIISSLALGILVFSCKAQHSSIIADDALLVKVDSTYSFTEGPASDKDGNVYFTDQPNDKIIKWHANDNSLSIFKEPSGRANGLYFDHDGNLLAAADENNELWRIDSNGNVDTLLTSFEDKKLNGPNDIWVDLKGGIYFTDPYYQREYWTRTKAEISEKNVYYISPDGKEVSIIASGFVQPNGIIGTPDGKTLYVADIGDKKTYAYTIQPNGTLTGKKLFTNMGSDGMTIDNKGNIYLTGDGVTVFNKKGEQIHHIPINENWTANITFGGKDQNILFITAMGAIYTLKMNVKGVRY
ncbi:SMP-30/gluconolactonase/LRE family protein [Maribacter dokdonensis]|uniref:Gluconolactonase n=1 Tax=Maribacter dokdonensis TaxID=320912 RepID=A0ABY0ULI6_9FLAO|nr:SMP-30/gluconolactonase/LRE family protein [Maribacter dokdonensis]MDP2526957.1 SMP-30/gluconolactonase/LRE family protein [Maribacter dokdonensis]SDS86522.1 gluconolactonase [Maribacter dokdonensis]